MSDLYFEDDTESGDRQELAARLSRLISYYHPQISIDILIIAAIQCSEHLNLNIESLIPSYIKKRNKAKLEKLKKRKINYVDMADRDN